MSKIYGVIGFIGLGLFAFFTDKVSAQMLDAEANIFVLEDNYSTKSQSQRFAGRDRITIVTPQPRVRYLTYEQARREANQKDKHYVTNIYKQSVRSDNGAIGRRAIPASKFYLMPYFGYVVNRKLELETEQRVSGQSRQEIEALVDDSKEDNQVFYGFRFGRDGRTARTLFDFSQRSFDYESVKNPANNATSYRGSVKSNVYVANLGLKKNFDVGSLIINVGGGVAHHKLSDIEVLDQNGALTHKVLGDSDINYVVQAGVGLTLNVSEDIGLDVGYHYNGYGPFASDSFIEDAASNKTALHEPLAFKMSDQTVEAGLIIGF